MLILTAKKRLEAGKGLGKLRTSGFVPGIAYGAGVNSVPIAIAMGDLLKVWKEAGESTLLSLSIADEEPKVVLIRELQRNPLTSKPIHVDFYQIRMDEELEVTVPLEFIGEAPAVREGIGVLVKNLREINIRAFPKDLPHEITVDLSSFQAIDDAIQVQNLSIPKGVSVLVPEDTIVAHIAPMISEKELEAAPEERTVEEVEVVGEKKGPEEISEESGEETKSAAKE